MIGPRWPRAAAAFLGFLWFLSLGGGRALNPADVDWLLAGDWLQHWLGWSFFRNEPWTFPLGTITVMPYPIGTNIGFTDSNPLMSLLLKPLSGLLPVEFQFIGPWLALCFALQGYMGAALTSVVTKDRVQQLFGGYLFVLSPVLMGRAGHDTLCAQWLLLGVMYLGFRDYPDAVGGRRAAWLAMAAVLLAAAIHPYLTAMTLVLALACFARLWRSRLIALGRAVLMGVATIAGMLGIFVAIGYFGGATVGAGGFGVYSADLLTLVDPKGYSGLLPVLSQRSTQWEGLGFLGLGGLVAAALGAILLVRRRPSLGGGRWIIAAASALLAFYALSVYVTYGGHTAFKLGWLYDPMEPLTSSFRASGRFIWSFHYLMLLLGIWGVTRITGASRQAAGTTLLALAVILQATDLKPDPMIFKKKPFRRASLEVTAHAAGAYQHLALYPMQVLGACGGGPDQEALVYRFMLAAYRMKLTYNSGILARLPIEQAREECAGLSRAVDAGKLDPKTIYVVSPGHVPLFQKAGASCGRFDGDTYCVGANSDATFRNFLAPGSVK